ncbi:hypothetical protein GCM10010919_26490 [Alishewanella longhuensis]|uniref:Uncharacterized protein n=1 Tax=Alishewanella longhuensis TaxID=1091037 RepID=A0ABQ3L0I1_9ALTE|nr:hypothetical protein [Alishewanella longhuensis]GHG73588.1 hypothetical protein GCM10010919_26490 [Alishewanella longhuensis]
MQTNATLENIIQSVTQDYWNIHQKPLLLSGLPKMLAKDCPDLQSCLNGKRLKDFISETAKAGGYKLVEHPLQQAKVGVVPFESEYSFSDVSDLPVKVRSTQSATLAFLRVLESLPENEADKVVIPMSVLIKLLK